MKSKRHKELLSDYENIKNKHLEKLANNILNKDDRNQRLKKININPNILDLF